MIGLDEKISFNDYQHNWDKVESVMAKQSPYWPPGKTFVETVVKGKNREIVRIQNISHDFMKS